jgi:hypothetical protein
MGLGIGVNVDDTPRNARHRGCVHRDLDVLAGRLLIQCRPRQATAAAEIAGAYSTGIVITGTSSIATARYLRDVGFDGPILCDANRYSGRRRIRAGRGIRPAWCRAQHELDLIALTDSGYLAKRNWIGLRTILRAAERQAPPVIAVLPLDARWFAASPVCEALAREINRYGIPVAIVIEHESDPFGVRYVVAGFLKLLNAVRVPMLLLRSDISALGALCHGAHAAAIGTTSALRHLYPELPHRRPPPPGISAFVTPLLTYHRLDTCERIVAQTPDLEHLWQCHCPVCGGATPDKLVRASRRETDTAAYLHSLYTQLDLHDQLSLARTREALISTWHETCSHALFIHRDLAQVMQRWRIPANLRGWVATTDDPHRGDIPHQVPEREQFPTPTVQDTAPDHARSTDI